MGVNVTCADSGEVDYHELSRALRRGAEQSLDPNLKPGAAGELQLKAANKSSSPAKRPEGGPKGFTAALAQNLPVSPGKDSAKP